MNGWLGWVVLLAGIAAIFAASLRRPSRRSYAPSPHGCTHGYWVPCSQCPLDVRERYNRNPEWFPVEVRDQDGRYLGGPWEPAMAPMPEQDR